jgi:hypothetical protein
MINIVGNVTSLFKGVQRMDDLKQKIHTLKDNQKKILSEYEALIKDYESVDFINENQMLKKEIHENKERLNDLEKTYEKTIKENQQLRVVLQEQILDEKLNILKVSKKKLDTYFWDQSSSHQNKLTAFEEKTKKQIESIKIKAIKHLGNDKGAILEQLELVSVDLNEKIRFQREQLALEEKNLTTQVSNHMDGLAVEEISEEVAQKRIKQNQIEMKIGLNWVNKIGIILILFGVAAASKYSYSTWFNDYMKGISFFLLGSLLLASGEWSYRKVKNVFATGLLGGGISVLYGAIFYSYFLLDIISLVTALLLSIIVTCLAVTLSLRYHSKTICSLGLVGGYLPLFSYIFAFGLSGSYFYAAMGYLFLLNFSILIISLWKKWSVVHYISFLFHLPALFYLVYHAPSETISILYSILTFVMYLVVVLAYPFKYRLTLQKLDIALLSLNTLFSCLILYFLFDKANLNDYRGFLALVFCLVYIGLGQFIEKVMNEEKYTMILFYATSLTFAVLMIPFQFGVQWLSLGWLIEGVILIIYGFRSQMKTLELAGWGIFTLCIGSFFVFDVLQMLNPFNGFVEYFDLKYFAVMAGMLIIMLFYLLEQRKNKIFSHGWIRENISYYKYFTLANVWIYLLYSSIKLYDYGVPYQLYHYEFYKMILVAFITIGLAYVFTKIPLVYDRIVKYFSLCLYGLGFLICLWLTISTPVLKSHYADNTALEYFSLGILIFYNVFVLFNARDILITFIREKYKNIELYPMIMSIYLLGNITAFLIVQFNLGDIGLLFSFIYLALAIGYILYGFKKRYVYVRRIGLGLALLSTTKLFIYDLSFLSAGSKIIAYFCFGILLLGISYIYQKISNIMGDQDIGENM